MALPNTIEIKFKGDSTALTSAIKSLDKATKSLINSQAKLVDKERKGSSVKDKHKKQVEALIISVKALGGQWSKNSTLLSLHRKALKGDKVAMQQLRNETRKYITTLGMTKKGMLDTAHSTRILGGSFAVLRSKLLIIAFAIMLVKNSIGKLVTAQGEQELAEKKLASSIGRRSTELLKFASIQQKVTAFGDEETITAMSLIGAYTDNEEAIKKLTVASMDLASAKGMDLATATDLVAKSVFSSTNALSRYGVTVEGNVGSTDRLNMATESLAKMYGGQAKAQAETMTNQLKSAGNAVGDTAEAVGRFLSPAIIRIAKNFRGASEAVTSYLDQLRLSNTELKGIVDTEKREAILLAKITKAKKELAIFEDGTVAGSVLAIEKREELIALEDQLALNQLGNIFVFTKAQKEHIARLDAQIERNLEMVRVKVQLGELQEVEVAKIKGISNSYDFLDSSQNAVVSGVQNLSKNMTDAILNAQNMKDAFVNSIKAMASEILSQAVVFGMLNLFTGGTFGAGKSFLDFAFGHDGGDVTASGIKRFHSGGFIGNGEDNIRRLHSGGLANDEVPAVLQQGEFVLSKQAVDTIGLGAVRSMNEGGGGAVTNVYIQGGIVQEDYVTNELLPAINKARALA